MGDSLKFVCSSNNVEKVSMVIAEISLIYSVTLQSKVPILFAL